MVVPKKGTSTLLARPCRVSIRWLAFQQGPSMSCRRVLLLLLGVRAASEVAGSLVLRLVGFVFVLRIRVSVSRSLRKPACGVAFTGAGLWSAEPVEGVLALLVVASLSGCVLVGCPLVVRGWGMLLLCWPLRSGGFSQNGALVVLVEVLPEPVVLLPLSAVFSLLAVCLGLRSGDVFPERLLALWVEVLPKMPCVCFGCRCSLSL
ncbi:hypothetical protein Taro_020401 [Colocasia esculenta]|uniref:Uncharacterized protein n=1 Tax=Colocasia esculenta TaxID=4460 RepID=A0A843UNL0_COLES|nr:hypothetical protein [Colocasia esculenta]